MNHNLVLNLIILFTLTNSEIKTQELVWSGYGTGASHLEIYEKKIKFQTIRDYEEVKFDLFKLKNRKYLIFDETANQDEANGNISLEFTNDNKDSLVLNYKTNKYLFIKKEIANYTSKNFISRIEYEILDPYRSVKGKLEFHKSGIIKESDHDNKTLSELKISTAEIDSVKQLIEKLDIKNLYASQRWVNHCNNNEYSLTFISSGNIRYNYTAIELRKPLVEIVNYLNQLKNRYKQKTYHH